MTTLSQREPAGTSDRAIKAKYQVCSFSPLTLWKFVSVVSPVCPQTEVSRLRSRCEVQKELLNAAINKTMFALLIEQQAALCELHFPRFSPAFVDRLRKYVSAPHSTKGAPPSATSQAEFESLSQQVQGQQVLVCALLSVRLGQVHSERSRAQFASRQQQNQRLSLTRESSVDLSGDPESADYYSLEAKKNRKRRRLVTSAPGDSYSHSSVAGYTSPRQQFHGQETADQHTFYADDTGRLQDEEPVISETALPLLQKLATMLQEAKQG